MGRLKRLDAVRGRFDQAHRDVYDHATPQLTYDLEQVLENEGLMLLDFARRVVEAGEEESLDYRCAEDYADGWRDAMNTVLDIYDEEMGGGA